jgi:magnesium chelatase subunit D
MYSGPLRRCLPFSAVKGMEDVKKALECIIADDDLLGVLIKGPTGTAKSVLARSFVDMLPGTDIVNIPQNITDEQLFGGLDIEEAIRFGRTSVKGGVLQKADGNILYLDNVNLFDPRTLNSILECAESGKVLIEREGISTEYNLRTKIIATMDPAEQALPDSLADRFDICVQSYTAMDEDDKTEIILANLDFEADPEGFSERYSKADSEVLRRIDAARRILKDVKLTRSDLNIISKVCIDLNVKGHRADISVARVSKILAALDERTDVSGEDIKEAAILCLLHRRKDAAKEKSILKPQEDKAPAQPPDMREHETVIKEDVPDEVEVKDPETKQEYPADVFGDSSQPERLGTVAEITGSVKERLDGMDNIERVRLHMIAGNTGRRRNITVSKLTGRYRGFRIPEGRSVDPAFDATVRAAAPYQRSRKSKGLSINIEQQDIREKIRIKRDSMEWIISRGCACT